MSETIERLIRLKDRCTDQDDRDALSEACRAMADLPEARRRRDEWKAKAEGYDELRSAVREKTQNKPVATISRLLLGAALIDARKEIEELRRYVTVLPDDMFTEFAAACDREPRP